MRMLVSGATLIIRVGAWNCNSGIDAWEGWLASKKQWCCAHSNIACDEFDCNAGLARWEEGWSMEKKSWCCANKNLACDQFDCNLGFDNWEAGWSDEKMGYCCRKANRGCRTSATVVSFDCNVGFDSWEVGWPSQKKSWCCTNKQRACEQWDCNWENPDNWVDAKKSYCCPKVGKGCSTTTVEQFDCNAGLANWEAGFSPEKKAWCCAHYTIACGQWNCAEGDPPIWVDAKRDFCCRTTNQGCVTTTVEQFDCNAGLANWEAGFAPEKKAWCCAHHNLACDQWNCVEGDPPAWVDAKRDFCCRTTNQGCVTTTGKLYDCNIDWLQWEEKWSDEQKTWCCVHEQRACDPYDCEEGDETSWFRVKQQFCCLKNGRGCTTTKAPFDCSGDRANWEALWAPDRKTWCCVYQNIACDAWHCTEGSPEAWPDAKRVFCCAQNGQGCQSVLPTTKLPYDCDMGYDAWEAAWSPEQKHWCCARSNRACDLFDCNAGVQNLEAGWSQEKKEFCCSKTGQGCGRTDHAFDCNLDYDKWDSVWSAEQRRWCCSHTNKACEQFNCNAGVANLEAGWSRPKKEYCCSKVGKGCAAGGQPFDCNAGLANWEAGFSTEKKEWCCQHQHVACVETTMNSPFDCNAGLSNWEEGFSPEKKTWCCNNRHVACETWDCSYQVPDQWVDAKKEYCCTKVGQGCTTTQVPFDCNAGLANWEEGFSPQKKSWCCSNLHIACDEWDCNFGVPETWHENKKTYCCPKTGQGCSTTGMLFDCNAGLANWEDGFSQEKKSWCCANHRIACDQWDCEFGVPGAWQPSKRVYCCQKNGRGCSTTTNFEFDCDDGYANWEAGWSAEKKTWCCKTRSLACDQWNCDEGSEQAWPQSKRDFCCPRTGEGCAATFMNKGSVEGSQAVAVGTTIAMQPLSLLPLTAFGIAGTLICALVLRSRRHGSARHHHSCTGDQFPVVMTTEATAELLAEASMEDGR